MIKIAVSDEGAVAPLPCVASAFVPTVVTMRPDGNPVARTFIVAYADHPSGRSVDVEPTARAEKVIRRLGLAQFVSSGVASLRAWPAVFGTLRSMEHTKG